MNERTFPELPIMPIALITQVREDFLKVDLENTQALIEKCRAELKTIKDKKDKKVQAALRKKKRVDLVKGLGAGALPHEKLHLLHLLRGARNRMSHLLMVSPGNARHVCGESDNL